MKNLLTLILAIVLSNFAAAAETPAFALTVRPIKSLAGLKLRMELKNISQNSKVVFQGALPWVDGVSGARLFGFRGSLEEGDSTLTPIRSVGAVFNSFKEIVIDPGASLVGDIDIEERFPEINELLRQESVFVYWTYLPLDTSLIKHQELTGAVFLRKRSK
ncbi:hypothetical protein [Acidovorax sp. ACV01]|uniref:hypothetical protein n=1 Tax=Acidovorax sp. ACV01 TaxID=2769311 RepID=UPI00177AD24D|nr:hypothetical protein [Acidovorax sp. ACV01]MBD9393955.1 hypothetical protein [Acidovorax sp. ACV01]